MLLRCFLVYSQSLSRWYNTFQNRTIWKAATELKAQKLIFLISGGEERTENWMTRCFQFEKRIMFGKLISSDHWLCTMFLCWKQVFHFPLHTTSHLHYPFNTPEMMEEFARMVELCEEKLLIFISYFWYLKKYEADLNKSRLAVNINCCHQIISRRQKRYNELTK